MARRESPIRLVERLRKYRVTTGRDTSIAGEIERLTKDVKKRQGASGGMADAWREVGPKRGDEVVGAAISLSTGGVLVVRVPDAAARYEVDVWLRSGGLETLRTHCKVMLRRVKLELGGA